jgi:hypothetical protein
MPGHYGEKKMKGKKGKKGMDKSDSTKKPPFMNKEKPKKGKK